MAAAGKCLRWLGSCQIAFCFPGDDAAALSADFPGPETFSKLGSAAALAEIGLGEEVRMKSMRF